MLDLIVSRYFYTPGAGFVHNFWTDFLYTYGLAPGWILFALGLIIVLLSPVVRDFRRYLREGLYLILTLVIGSGLICHAGLKDNWGRPRPKQIIEFGGHAPFHPFWKMDRSLDRLNYRSFCCGHCTMGFYFFALYFLGKKRGWRKISAFGLYSGLFLGGALSWARIAQGGHFLSDTVVSALVMGGTAYLLSLFLLRKGEI